MILIFAEKGTKKRYAVSSRGTTDEDTNNKVTKTLEWLNLNSNSWEYVKSSDGGILYEGQDIYLG